jgi:hypothetical protein
MSDHSTCTKCGAWADGAVAVCPRCGGPMQLKKGSTLRGWVLLFLGLFLMGMMGAIIGATMPTMLNPGAEIDGGRFTGTAEQGRMFLGLFLLVFIFGTVSTLYGLFQIVTRRESKAFITISLVLALGLVAVTFFILYFMPK